MMGNGNGSIHGAGMRPETPLGNREYQQSVIEVSEDSIDSINKVEEWKMLANGTGVTQTSPTANMSGIQGRHSGSQMANGISSPRENGKMHNIAKYYCLKIDNILYSAINVQCMY